MTKKNWIYVKRGLSEDPKHRAAMGECVWLFMHIIDRADWETGIVHNWKDEEEAADMSMNSLTLRDQRQKLQRLDYIRCTQRRYSQDIAIMEWINPRDYSAGVKNRRNELTDPEFQGKPITSPLDFQGNTQGKPQGNTEGNTQGLRKSLTPTSDSESISTSSSDGQALAAIVKAYESEIGLITAFIANDLQDAADTYPVKWVLDGIHEAAVQNKRSWKYIEAILKRWKAQGNQDTKKGTLSNGQLATGPAPAINERAVESTIKELTDKWNFKPAPPPSTRPRIGKANS